MLQILMYIPNFHYDFFDPWIILKDALRPPKKGLLVIIFLNPDLNLITLLQKGGQNDTV